MPIQPDHKLSLDLGPTQKMHLVAESKGINNRLLTWTLIAADTQHPEHHPLMPALFPVFCAQLPQIKCEGERLGIADEQRAKNLLVKFAESLVPHVTLLAEQAGQGPLVLEYPKSWETHYEQLQSGKAVRASESRATTFRNRRFLAEELFSMSRFGRRLEILNVNDKARSEIEIASFYNFARACGLRDARQAMWHHIERMHNDGSSVLETVFRVRQQDSDDFIRQLGDGQGRMAISTLQNVLVRIKRTSYLGRGTVLLPFDYWSAPKSREVKN